MNTATATAVTPATSINIALAGGTTAYLLVNADGSLATTEALDDNPQLELGRDEYGNLAVRATDFSDTGPVSLSRWDDVSRGGMVTGPVNSTGIWTKTPSPYTVSPVLHVGGQLVRIVDKNGNVTLERVKPDEVENGLSVSELPTLSPAMSVSIHRACGVLLETAVQLLMGAGLTLDEAVGLFAGAGEFIQPDDPRVTVAVALGERIQSLQAELSRVNASHTQTLDLGDKALSEGKNLYAKLGDREDQIEKLSEGNVELMEQLNFAKERAVRFQKAHLYPVTTHDGSREHRHRLTEEKLDRALVDGIFRSKGKNVTLTPADWLALLKTLVEIKKERGVPYDYTALRVSKGVYQEAMKKDGRIFMFRGEMVPCTYRAINHLIENTTGLTASEKVVIEGELAKARAIATTLDWDDEPATGGG